MSILSFVFLSLFLVSSVLSLTSLPLEKVDVWLKAIAIVLAGLTVAVGVVAFFTGEKLSDKLKFEISRANEEAGKANREAARIEAEGKGRVATVEAESREKTAALETEAEQAKKERAEADKQIAIAKQNAARAKEGIANAEARSIEASAEVSRLRVTVANAEKERAQAQKALIELQRRIAARVITDADAERITEQIRQYRGREFQVVTFWDDREPLATAQRLADILVAAGWKLNQPKEGQFLLGGLGGIQVFFHPEASPEAKRSAEALVAALNSVGLSAVIKQINDPGHPTEKIHVNVGTKPT